MYMFLLGQDFPGRGKRDLKAAVAEKDVALAETESQKLYHDLLSSLTPPSI